MRPNYENFQETKVFNRFKGSLDVHFNGMGSMMSEDCHGTLYRQFRSFRSLLWQGIKIKDESFYFEAQSILDKASSYSYL